MSYTFKNIADVELLSTMPENANVLVEVDGATRRAPKEDGIGKLVNVEALEEVPEGATVLAEVNGEIKRVPGAGLGGGGIKTAIIKDSEYDNALAGVQSAIAAPTVTFECLNMTFEEAYQTMASGEPLGAIGMINMEGMPMPVNISGMTIFTGIGFGVPCIGVQFTMAVSSTENFVLSLYWTADGLSTEAPSEPK